MPIVIEDNHKVFLLWLWLYICNSIICFLYSPQGDIELKALDESFRASALLFSFFIILQGHRAIHVCRLALVMVLLLAVIMNIIDFITPLWSKVPGRAAGFYVNPTISGKMLVLIMVASIPIIPKKFRLIYCAYAGIGVLVTFSRGPWLLWLIAVIGMSISGHLQTTRKAASIVLVSFLSSFVIYSALSGGLLDFMAATGTDEYLTRGTVARLGGGGTVFNDYSTESRAAAITKAWQVFSESPWFGAGLGHDYGWSVGTHNTYLKLAAEGGLFRLGVFLILLISLWRMTDNIGRITLVVYAASSMTSHNNLQAPSLLVFLALIAVSARSEGLDNVETIGSKKRHSKHISMDSVSQ